MTDMEPFRIRSGLSLADLEGMAERLRLRAPEAFRVLSNPASSDPDLYESTSGGMFGYVKQNEAAICGEKITDIAKAQIDLVNYLAGRIHDSN